MTDQRLTTLEIDGFTSIRSARVTLGSLNVLVGANGAGKSNFIRALELLGRIADGELNLFVGLNGGASALLNLAGQGSIRLHVEAPPNAYTAELTPAANDELIFLHEWAPSIPDGGPPYLGYLGSGHRETRLPEDPGARGLLNLFRSCRVYHFHDTSVNSPAKRLTPTADNLALRQDAGNLAAVLLSLRDNNGAAYRRIVGAVRQVTPFFRDFVLVPEADDRIRLRWRQVDSDVVFSANQMSDGTLRFICLATLLLHPEPPPLLVLDEPELGQHPYAIVLIAALLRQVSLRSQVVVATQSVTLMNQFQIDDLIVVERKAGGSIFERPDRNKLENWLQDYSLGELWEKNLIGGRPGDSRFHA